MRPEEKFMRLAIKEARKNLRKMEGGPFGACIVRDGKVIAVARNTVLISDASAHAEVNAIRFASKRLKDFKLSGCVIYSTTEPCPMCFSAIHWSRLDAVIYGTTVADAKKLGFNELQINCKKMRDEGVSDVKIYPAFLRRECLELFNDWKKLENKRLY
ncbi:MAG: nucleoside deaminase [Candidatus Omnitrophica bacterium]|nr:nucleoside deaminase [Candidatus Omnitrophota bacterium]